MQNERGQVIEQMHVIDTDHDRWRRGAAVNDSITPRNK